MQPPETITVSANFTSRSKFYLNPQTDTSEMQRTGLHFVKNRTLLGYSLIYNTIDGEGVKLKMYINYFRPSQYKQKKENEKWCMETEKYPSGFEYHSLIPLF